MSQTTSTNYVEMQKMACLTFLEKVRFSIGNFDLLAYSIFKNIEISSAQ